jgi:hypothetical protein
VFACMQSSRKTSITFSSAGNRLPIHVWGFRSLLYWTMISLYKKGFRIYIYI